MRVHASLVVLTVAAAIAGFTAVASAGEMMQLDPFARATTGYPGCPEQPPPLMTAEEARTQAHVRSERGLRCAMEGKCEPGGSYRRDPEINEQVRAAVAADKRFANTSVWLTTSRKWVTLQGCVRSSAQRKALDGFVQKQANVERVFDELRIGTGSGAR